MLRAEHASAVAVFAAAVVLVLVPEAPPVVRIPAGAILLLAPGYAGSLLFFPRGTTGGAERLVSTLALAFSIVIVLSLGLNLVWDLSPRSWALALGIFGVAAAGHTALTPGNGPHTGESRRARLLSRGPRESIVAVTLSIVLILVVVGAVMVARRPLSPPPGVAGYTQLWLVPRDGSAELGVGSFELQPTSYRLELVSDQTVLGEWEIRLPPNGRWTVEPPTADGVVEARLFRDGDAVPYRQVRVRLSTAESS